jgi:glycosyltransferase involved in cell wall biosynthesis
MRYPDTGIYHYCLNLGRELKTALGGSGVLQPYVPAHEAGRFEGPALHHDRLHKYRLPALDGVTLWHATFQHSNYVPGRGRKLKVLLTVHDLNFLYDDHLSPEKKEQCLRGLQQRVDRADMIICISAFCKGDLEAHCTLNGKEVRVIHNGTNPLAQPALKAESVRPARPFVFAIGELRRKKNFHSWNW